MEFNPQEDHKLTVVIIVAILLVPIGFGVIDRKRLEMIYRNRRHDRLVKRWLARQQKATEEQARRNIRQVSAEYEQVELGQLEAGPLRQLSEAKSVHGWQDTIAFPERVYVRASAVKGSAV